MPSRSPLRVARYAPAFASVLIVAILQIGAPALAQPAPIDTLTLPAALDRASSVSPDLRAADLEASARTALARQAGRLPNPVFDTEAENVGSSGPEETIVTARIAQLLELGGDRSARQQVAAREADRAITGADLARLNLTAQARTRFASAAAAQARLDLARDAVRLAEATLDATAEQVDAGDRSPVDETRAEVALAEARADVFAAEASRRAAFWRLAALWAEAPDFDAVAPLPPPEVPPDPDVLFARLRESAAFAMWDVEAERRAAVLRLEQARRIPDVTISAGYRRFTETGDRAFVGGIALPVPVFDRNGRAVAAARVRLEAAGAEQEAALVAARGTLAEVYGELDAAYAEARALGMEVLPRAVDVAARIEEGYRAGKFSLLDVLDAQRTLTDLRTRDIVARAAYYAAAAEVERLTASLTDQP